jgi:hypothetical protein
LFVLRQQYGNGEFKLRKKLGFQESSFLLP